MSDTESQRITLFVADVWKNEMMRCVDLRPDYKWYVTEMPMKITGMDDTTIEKLKDRMKASRDNKDFYIPAIKLGNTLIKDDGVKELSDGCTSMFIGD